MEKRWDELRAPAPQAIATGTISAGVLLLAAWALRGGLLAREVGTVIGVAAVAVVRSIFAALGGFLAR